MSANQGKSNSFNRKKIILVDLWSHTNTQSVDFAIELLKKRFDVDVRYVHSRYDKKMITKEEMSKYAAAVYFQVTPSNIRARSFRKPQIYIPMYDSETFNIARWRRIGLQHGSAICFSRIHSELLTKANVAKIDVKFYPPRQPFVPGNPRKLFLWDRNFIGFRAIKSLFKPGQLEEVVIRCSEDHAKLISDDEKTAFKVKIISSHRYVSREEYQNLFADCGLYLAPRRKEGIGMSFLEALSMGKCVIAHDDHTMNEYINHLDNGVLVDFLKNRHENLDLSIDKILDIQKLAYSSCVAGRNAWESQEEELLNFIEEQICNYRAMGFWELISWWLLLPFHFLWDIRSYFVTKFWPRIRRLALKSSVFRNRSIAWWN